MLTIKTEVQKDRKRADGTYNVKLRFTKDRVVKRISTNLFAINKCGIDKYTVHAALNHVDVSMRVTDIYIQRDFVNENKANAKVMKFVFGR